MVDIAYLEVVSEDPKTLTLYRYKAISEAAKKLLKLCTKDKDGYVISITSPKSLFSAPGIFSHLTFEKEGAESRPLSDPDGKLVPLPIKQPHRYEILGYIPNKFGEH